MIEILQFGLGANRGGIETYLKKIWDHIDHSRFHFNFINMTGEGSQPCFYEELKASGCAFYPVTPRSVSPRKNQEDLRRLFRERHFDILHFNVNTLSYMYPVEAALRADCKVLVHSRSNGLINNSRFTKLLHEINKRRLGHMDVTRIAVSKMAGEWLFGRTPFRVYPNGIAAEQFAFDPENRKRVREETGCTGKRVIGHVGAFIPAKNHRFMVEAFEELSRHDPDAVLWLIGDGGGRAEIERLVREIGLQEKVLFFGNRKDMPALYAGMDMLWLPSLHEGFPNVILEAQCEGLPCLISDCIPQDALVADNTFSFGLDQPLNQWANKIEEALLAQKEKREECWRELEERGFSAKDEVKRIEALYSSILCGDT